MNYSSTIGGVVTLKTGSNPGRVCRPSRSEFSVVFSETRVNTGKNPLERQPRGHASYKAQVPQAALNLQPNRVIFKVILHTYANRILFHKLPHKLYVYQTKTNL